MGHITQTHCKWGHEFTPENTYYRKKADKKHRRCRACSLESNKVWDVYKRSEHHAPKHRRYKRYAQMRCEP